MAFVVPFELDTTSHLASQLYLYFPLTDNTWQQLVLGYSDVPNHRVVSGGTISWTTTGPAAAGGLPALTQTRGYQIILPAAPAVNTTNNIQTAAFWARLDNFTAENKFFMTTRASVGPGMAAASSTGSITINHQNSSQFATGGFATLGQWDHYVYAGSGQAVNVYRNGELLLAQGSLMAAGTFFLPRSIGGAPNNILNYASANAPLTIAGGFQHYMLWLDRQLSGAEVAELYSRGGQLLREVAEAGPSAQGLAAILA